VKELQRKPRKAQAWASKDVAERPQKAGGGPLKILPVYQRRRKLENLNGGKLI